MLSKKRKTRELAMQVLFVWDSNGVNDADLARQIVTDGSPDEEVRTTAVQWAGGGQYMVSFTHRSGELGWSLRCSARSSSTRPQPWPTEGHCPFIEAWLPWVPV